MKLEEKIKEVPIFKLDFKSIITYVLKYKIPQTTLFYEPSTGATTNIINTANELCEKGYKVAILVKTKIFISETKKNVDKRILVHCNSENLRGLELDFVFLDNFHLDVEDLIYSKHAIQLLRNNTRLL